MKKSWVPGFCSKKKKNLGTRDFLQKKKNPGYRDLQGKFFGRFAPDQNPELRPNGPVRYQNDHSTPFYPFFSMVRLIETGQLLHTLTGHNSFIREFFIPKDDSFIFSVGFDGCRRWSTEGETLNNFSYENLFITAIILINKIIHNLHHCIYEFHSTLQLLMVLQDL